MDPDVHEVNHKAGLASLGASEEERERICSVLWYTFEMGLTTDDKNERRLLGGSLLSSSLEAQNAMSHKANVVKFKDFDELRYEDI
jgi:phenylalanine-4-hydroxylase